MNNTKLRKIINFASDSVIDNQEVRELINRWYEIVTTGGENRETREIIKELERIERATR
jgi:hypothetical protein